MFCLKIENARGEIFELTHDTKNYAIVHVDGLTPPKSLINTSVGGGMDGTFYNSARVDQRNIVLTVVFNGDIEGNRQRLYKMFPQKSPCIIYFSNANRNVKITGYVEAMEADLFVQREQMQISLICPRPFWESLECYIMSCPASQNFLSSRLPFLRLFRFRRYFPHLYAPSKMTVMWSADV